MANKDRLKDNVDASSDEAPIFTASHINGDVAPQDHNLSRKLREERRLKKYKWIKTVVFTVIWMAFGIILCMTGTTLPDFLHRIKRNNEQYGRLKIIDSIVSGVLGVISGILVDRNHHQSELIIAIGMALLGITQAALPWCRNQYTALLVIVMNSSTAFVVGTTVTAYVIAMWGEHAKVPIHILHIGFPLGCALGPLLAKPFISEQLQPNRTAALEIDTTLYFHNATCGNIQGHDDCIYNKGNITQVLMEESHDFPESQIEIPFAISGVLMSVFSIIMFAYHFNFIKKPDTFILHREPTKSLKDVFNPKLWGAGKPLAAAVVYVAMILFYVLLNAIESPLTNLFLFTYAVKSKFHFSSARAAYLDFTFKASMLVGRICAIPFSHYFSIKVIMFTELIASCVISILLATIGTQTETGFWVLLCVLNFVLSPLWPGGMAWANNYVVLYTSMIAFVDIIARVSDGLFTWMVGYILDHRDPNDMWYILSTFFGIMLVIFTLAQLFASRSGERFESVVTPVGNEMEETGALLNGEGCDDEALLISANSHLELDVES